MCYFFNIKYEFDKQDILQALENVQKGYICVADGVVMSTANRDNNYLNAVNGGLFSICDSSWVPLYIKAIYGISYEQYCGADIFKDIVSSRKYRMLFMGTHKKTLDALKIKLIDLNPNVKDMSFIELPFCNVDEQFMSKLLPHLEKGVMIGVGAVFKFFSGTEETRCPNWMRKLHLEFIYRIMQNPRKQLKRCYWILATLPKIIMEEIKKKKLNTQQWTKTESLYGR